MKAHGAILGLALLLAGTVAAQQPPAQPGQPAPQAPRGGGMGPMPGMPGMQGMGPMAGMMGPGMRIGLYAPDRLVDRREVLGLTPDQVSKLDALAQDATQARDKAQTDAKSHWDQLAELWKQPNPDVAQVRTHAQAAMQAMEAAHVAQLVAAAQAKAVLTPEQRGRVAGWGDAARMRMNRMGPGMRGQRRMPGRMGRPGRTPRGR